MGVWESLNKWHDGDWRKWEVEGGERERESARQRLREGGITDGKK